MTFEIRPIDRATFDAIWTATVKKQLNGIIHSTANWFDYFNDTYWAIDDATQTCFVPVAMANKFDSANCYALVQCGEYALIRKVGYGTYAVAAHSGGFSQRMEEVKQLAAKALMLGGGLMAGNPDPRPNLRSVTEISYVNFVEYVAPKIGE